jgi:single-strand DNA-binding protein
MAPAVATGGTEAQEWANEVRLVGRISADVEERDLPSGDRVAQLRLVVPRAEGSRGASVDTVDVACWTGKTRLAARRLRQGDEVEVVGSLRRRFFRAGGGTASRYEVEAIAVVRLRRP